MNAAQESTAGRPALSVAEAKRLHQQELAAANGEMAALMERARALEEDGKPNVAKIYYQRIAKHATGELQQQARPAVRISGFREKRHRWSSGRAPCTHDRRLSRLKPDSNQTPPLVGIFLACSRSLACFTQATQL